ncbi:MAG: DUF5606 domain-containing protein [Salibacteraceae bacterium]
MDLTKIISISGKPGLFEIVGQMKNGVVVESLLDGRRTPAYATQQISSLEDISIYSDDDDVPLKDIFGMIKAKENGGKVTLSSNNNSAFKAYFEEVFPDFDRDRVYTSDIKKVVKWYNLLMEKGYLEEEEAEATEEAPLVEDAEIVEERTEEASTTSEAPESTTTEEED